MSKSMLASATVAAAVALADPSPAHAMGSYISYTLVAWSDDGASALLTEWHASSATAGSSVTYVLVGAADGAATPARYAFDNTVDPDHAKQRITAAECGKAAASLASDLTAHHFKGVAVRKDRCTDAGRATVVTIDATAARTAEMSWVAQPVARRASPREEAAWKLAATVTAVEPKAAAPDVASTTGKLVLVCYGQSGDSSGPKYCTAFAGTKKLAEL
jgi:hypothetical protein